MEDTNTYLETLEAALEKKYSDLENRCIRVLKESFRKYHQAFKNYYDLLVRKALIAEDPYKFELKVSSLEVPPKGPISDSEKTVEMGKRLSAFEIQLDFLNNYYQFKTEELDLKQIKILAGLCQYILWDRMSPGSNSLNTRVLADLSEKVKQGNDSLSSGILSDGEKQMAEASREIMASLKEIMFYHKQYYKILLRKTVFPAAKIDTLMVESYRDEAFKKVKHAFAETLRNEAFYPELVQEVLDEDYTPSGATLKNDILTHLAVEAKEKPKRQGVDYRSILMDAVKALGMAGPSLYNAGLKANDNLVLLQSKKISISERFRLWLQRVVQKTEESMVYDIEYFDEKTSSSKTMKLDIKKFLEKTLSRGKLLQSVSNKMSPRYQKLENADEGDVYSFLEKQIMEVQTILHTLTALDTFFKTEVQRDQRKQVKGLKLEITAIKNNLLKANQKRYEYVSRKEEMEQLKKLGININDD
ncbi:MAG: hypothetical protein JW760_02195 [Spirochaetales bacterium]|nr:hypothetical protein [Spirochaetales bacterium]